MRTALAVAVISAAALAYEVLLVRLFAIVQWHHFAFMAIGIALLGFGASGTMLALAQDWARRRFTAVFVAGAVLFALSAPGCFLLVQALPFNALAVVWNPAELVYLPVMFAVLALPFFGAATCIGLALMCHGQRIGGLYACNLVGSGAGALGIVAALFVLEPQDGLRLVAGLGLAAAALVAWRGRTRAWAGGCLLAIAVAVLLPDAWLALRISPFKGLPQALQVSGARLIGQVSSPLALLSVVDNPQVPFRYVPGLSLNAPAAPPEQFAVFVDGGAMTAITPFLGDPATLGHLDYTTDALPYHLLTRPEVLVLGAGGGTAVLQAIGHHARHVDAVELNANMVDLVGGIYARPDVTVHVAEARAFVSASPRRWDLIQMPLLDAFGTGLHGLAESHLYTLEAFDHYLARLRPGGWLAITRWLRLPPRDSLRLFATALEALRRRGVAAPERQLILLRGFTTTTLLVKNGAVTDAEVARLKRFADERAFDLGHYPGIRPGEANRNNILDQPYFYAGAQALIGDGRASFLARYKFDVAPTSDDRPYFFDFLKWRTLPELLALRQLAGAGLLELGRPILLATLVQAAALSALLILAPLRWHRPGRAPQRWRVAGYFLALGLAFLFVEIAFIQKLTLFLGHPLAAVAVALAGFLLFAGVGSALSARVGRWRHAVPVAVLAVAGLALLSLAALPALFATLLHLPDAAKVGLALAAIAPLALAMGLPFPLGLARVAATTPALVPWAWGVNGCASVLSATLATLIAVQFGFTAVVLAAAALYAAAAALAPRRSA